MKSAEEPDPTVEDDDSSQSDPSESEMSTSSSEDAEKSEHNRIDGNNKPLPTIITREFTMEVMITYVCENQHPLETTFFSSSLKLARSESLSNSLT